MVDSAVVWNFPCGESIRSNASKLFQVYEKEIFQSDQELGGFLEIETPNAEKVILYVEKNLQHHLKVAWKDLNAEYIRDDIAKKSQKALI